MNNQPYSDYIESGIDFIGKIPNHWYIKKAKHVAKFNMGQAPDSKSVNDTGDGLPFIQGNAEFGTVSPTEKNYCTEPTKICSQGNILVSVRAPVGALNIADKPYVIGRGLAAIQPSDLMDKSYFWFLFQSQIPQLLKKETGTTFKAVSGDDLRNLSFPVPNIAEQRDIAAFLEIEAKRIDSLIVEKQTFIDLLKEKRQALISHFVTKGLDANVAMRDSGVDWIGSIPAHWEMKRAKYLFDLAKREPLEDDEIVTAFRDGQVTQRSKRRTDGFTNAIKEAGYQRVHKGDLVIHAMDGFAGAIGVSDSTGKCTPVYSCCVPRAGINVDFYGLFLRNMALTGFVTSLAKGIRERSTDFRWKDFSAIKLPVPPMNEQFEIFNFLSQNNIVITEILDEFEVSIELLREHRTALISAAVTGKIDVRGIVDTKEG